jgi:hypothetical protein
MASDVNPANVRRQLEQVINSKAFASSARSGKLLRFLVEGTLNGNADELKEYTLGVKALERRDSFDPRTDPGRARLAKESGGKVPAQPTRQRSGALEGTEAGFVSSSRSTETTAYPNPPSY